MPAPARIDRHLDGWDFREVHAISVAAPPARVYAAARELDLSGSRVVRALYRLRGLPASALSIEGLERMGFVLLDEEPGREFVLGLVGRFWTARGDIVRLRPEEFSAYAEPGRAKVAWNFRVEPDGSGSDLRTETRILCLDPGSLRRFRRYWLLVRPFSGVIRRAMLRSIRDAAERPGLAPESPGSGGDAGAE